MTRHARRGMIFWITGLLLCTTAQSAVSAESPLVLGEILKKTESYYQQMQAFTATFRQWTTSSAASAMATEAVGRLYYQKPRQMRWEYDKPEPQVFVANQQLAWLHVPSENQISLFDAKSFFASPLAQTFFDGIVQLKSHFEVTLDFSQSTSESAVLKLLPRQPDPNIQSLFLWIDLQTHRILAIESLDALGNTNRIILESQKATPHLDSKLFQLDIPPSTVVVDLEGRQLKASDIEKLKLKLAPGQDKP